MWFGLGSMRDVIFLSGVRGEGRVRPDIWLGTGLLVLIGILIEGGIYADMSW